VTICCVRRYDLALLSHIRIGITTRTCRSLPNMHAGRLILHKESPSLRTPRGCQPLCSELLGMVRLSVKHQHRKIDSRKNRSMEDEEEAFRRYSSTSLRFPSECLQVRFVTSDRSNHISARYATCQLSAVCSDPCNHDAVT
jgi:hypothetical protein